MVKNQDNPNNNQVFGYIKERVTTKLKKTEPEGLKHESERKKLIA